MNMSKGMVSPTPTPKQSSQMSSSGGQEHKEIQAKKLEVTNWLRVLTH